MARLSPAAETIRALFARSGNQCAFPGCTQHLINHKNQFVGQVCHIEAAMPGGERYNEFQTDEQRRHYNNLLLMCYAHHIETDDVSEYPVKRLVEIKNEHENKFLKADFKIDESALYKLMQDMEQYWTDIERLNTHEHSFKELAIDVNAKASGLDILVEANEAYQYIQDILEGLHESDLRLQDDFEVYIRKKGIDPKIFSDISFYENPFHSRNWESHNLGARNWMLRLQISLVHIEVKYLEEYLKTNANDLNAKRRLEEVMETLRDFAQHATCAD